MKKVMWNVGLKRIKFDHWKKFSKKIRWAFYAWRFYDRESEVIKRGVRLFGVAFHLREMNY